MLAAIVVLIACVTRIHSSVIMSPQQFQTNYFQYATYNNPIPWERIFESSLDMAIRNCQEQFRWQRWDCPTKDFYLRRTSDAQLLDREDVYVLSIEKIAVLYTLTKVCSSGKYSECGCTLGQCVQNPSEAIKIFEAEYGISKDWKNDYLNEVAHHNHRAVTKLLEDSLEKQCVCIKMDINGQCKKEHCTEALKSFDKIAKELREMYEEAVQLETTITNVRVVWMSIPLKALVFMKNSPNHCKMNTETEWPGTSGRLCARKVPGQRLTAEDRKSCAILCKSCGYRVRSELVRHEQSCKCKWVWGFPQCETCIHSERQYYCH